jgi:hypothetical protein
MTEDQKQVYREMVARGVWIEADAYRQTLRQEFRGQGLPKQEAGERAWRMMVERFVSGDGQADNRPEDNREQPEAITAGAAVEVAASIDPLGDDAQPVPCEHPMPVGPGGSYAADVAWVYANHHLVVTGAPGKPRCDFAKATCPPPSGGAIGLMEWAAENRTAFFKDTAPKVLNASEGLSEELAQEERGIEEVRGILADFNRNFHRRLVEDAPATLRTAVQQRLDDWQRRSGVELPDAIRDSLDASVVDLCNSVRNALQTV